MIKAIKKNGINYTIVLTNGNCRHFYGSYAEFKEHLARRYNLIFDNERSFIEWLVDKV